MKQTIDWEFVAGYTHNENKRCKDSKTVNIGQCNGERSAFSTPTPFHRQSFEPKNGDERNAVRNLRFLFLLYHHQCPCQAAFLSIDHLASVTDFSHPVLQALAF